MRKPKKRRSAKRHRKCIGLPYNSTEEQIFVAWVRTLGYDDDKRYSHKFVGSKERGYKVVIRPRGAGRKLRPIIDLPLIDQFGPWPPRPMLGDQSALMSR